MKYSASALVHVFNLMRVVNILRLLFLCAFFTPNIVWAQDLRIAIVDVEKISNQSKAGQSIQNQLKERRTAFQKEFSAREDKLAKAEKLLIEEKNNLSGEEFSQKRKDFETQLLETRNLFQKRRNSLDKGVANALAVLRKSIVETAAAIADKENYNIVLSRDSVVIAESEMDITDKVMTAMNKKLPKINLVIKE